LRYRAVVHFAIVRPTIALVTLAACGGVPAVTKIAVDAMSFQATTVFGWLATLEAAWARDEVATAAITSSAAVTSHAERPASDRLSLPRCT